jgi:hypothetical protein
VDKIKHGVRYVVTSDSDDGTFLKGDHVFLDKSGDICCVEAHGWITKENVAEAVVGATFGIDSEYYDKKLKKAQAIIEEIKNLTMHAGKVR